MTHDDLLGIPRFLFFLRYLWAELPATASAQLGLAVLAQGRWQRHCVCVLLFVCFPQRLLVAQGHGRSASNCWVWAFFLKTRQEAG